MADLAACVEQSQFPADVARGVEWLIANGYVAHDAERLRLTEHGQSMRDAIEAETDRLYFAPWPPLAQTQVDWISTTLHTICEKL